MFDQAGQVDTGQVGHRRGLKALRQCPRWSATKKSLLFKAVAFYHSAQISGSVRSQWEARPLTAIGSEHERQNKGDTDCVTRLKFGKIRPDTQRYTKQGVRSIENPFSPSFGLVPPIYLDRDQHLALLLRETTKSLPDHLDLWGAGRW